MATCVDCVVTKIEIPIKIVMVIEMVFRILQAGFSRRMAEEIGMAHMGVVRSWYINRSKIYCLKCP